MALAPLGIDLQGHLRCRRLMAHSDNLQPLTGLHPLRGLGTASRVAIQPFYGAKTPPLLPRGLSKPFDRAVFKFLMALPLPPALDIFVEFQGIKFYWDRSFPCRACQNCGSTIFWAWLYCELM
eukprot:CAMPEP_0196655694 /NCGR_PEP_ID=MMETSP1086-20130531/6015_1 /TAXON_ID=77921 /ORGANISM="Cyanoptyche  gloeocystis , Strain SAG4.97" /LENGTH=122 /DNA_ID=CAMNT_0041988149 /DNA_START=393 /DNA_END=761 /DNA_ORIENTATION=-